MKLSQYAKKVGISYKTAHRWWKAGQLAGYQLPSGTIVIDDEKPVKYGKIACIYARVDSETELKQLNKQVQKLQEYAIANKYRVAVVYREIAKGHDDNRELLAQALKQDDYNILLIENLDVLATSGLNYIKILLEKTGKKLEVADLSLMSNSPKVKSN